MKSRPKRCQPIMQALCLLGIVVLLAMMAPSTEGETITVDDDGPADYHSIQEAVDNASDFDTILVFEGQYNGTITIDKPITIEGSLKNQTIIDGLSRVGLDITHNSVYLINLTIHNSSIGIYGHESTNITIENIIIINNFDSGISFHRSKNIIINSSTVNNNGVFGIWITNSSNIFIRNSSINNHNHSIGGIPWNNINKNYYHGIWISYSNRVFIDNNSFDLNRYSITMIRDINIKIVNNTITEGQFGIQLSHSENVTIHNNYISNQLDISIDIQMTFLTLIHNNVINNGNKGVYLLSSFCNSINYNSFINHSIGIEIDNLNGIIELECSLTSRIINNNQFENVSTTMITHTHK